MKTSDEFLEELKIWLIEKKEKQHDGVVAFWRCEALKEVIKKIEQFQAEQKGNDEK